MYWIKEEECTGCGACMNVCPSNAIYMVDDKACIDENRCNGCGTCVKVCPKNAIHEKEPVFANQVPISQTTQNVTAPRSSPVEYHPFITLINSIFEDFLDIPFGGIENGSRGLGFTRRGRRGRSGRGRRGRRRRRFLTLLRWPTWRLRLG